MLHRSQDDAIIDLGQYRKLIATECSPYLRLFLCAYFIPVCTVLEEPIPPCRSLCRQVQTPCELVMRKFVNLPWPEMLSCDKFPENGGSGGKLCIPPKTENKVKKLLPDRRGDLTDGDRAILECSEPYSVNVKRFKHKKPSTCNRTISSMILKRKCHGKQTCQFKMDDLTSYGQPSTCIPGKIGQAVLKYTCSKARNSGNTKSVTIQYQGNPQDLFCKSNSRRIFIHQVKVKNKTCLSPNAFCSISQRCTGTQRCSLYANSSELSAHCRKKGTKLDVTYECIRIPSKLTFVTRSLEESRGHMTGLQLSCPDKKTLSIVRAEYVNANACAMKEIYCVVNLLCHEKNSCDINDAITSDIRCESDSRVRIQYACT